MPDMNKTWGKGPSVGPLATCFVDQFHHTINNCSNEKVQNHRGISTQTNKVIQDA